LHIESQNPTARPDTARQKLRVMPIARRRINRHIPLAQPLTHHLLRKSRRPRRKFHHHAKMQAFARPLNPKPAGNWLQIQSRRSQKISIDNDFFVDIRGVSVQIFFKMNFQNALTIAATGLFISSVSASVTIDWVTVGNAGNTGDSATYNQMGAVGYVYQIGKYEVTNAQYSEFLNAKATDDSYELYHIGMGINRDGNSGNYTYSVTEGYGNEPVAFVSWFDAARFSNWLANGQGSGSTETGSYTLNGATSGIIYANESAKIRIPTESEWYKAAYYNGGTQTYSLYPNGLSIISTLQANYDPYFTTGERENYVGRVTAVGTYSNNPSYYGTYDQGGNVREWNDGDNGLGKGVRGGSWDDPESEMANTALAYSLVTWEVDSMGFRLASVNPIPEPTASLLGVLGTTMFLRRRRK
jgi:formylglycine-generating enzyme required for sulfatase activity